MLLGVVAQAVEHDAGLDARELPLDGRSRTIRLRYFEKSSTTATFTAWPARLVPPPRETTGASCSRHAGIAATTSSTVRGMTTPIGTCR